MLQDLQSELPYSRLLPTSLLASANKGGKGGGGKRERERGRDSLPSLPNFPSFPHPPNPLPLCRLYRYIVTSCFYLVPYQLPGQNSARKKTLTNPRYGWSLTHVHSHISREVAANDSCFVFIKTRQHGCVCLRYC